MERYRFQPDADFSIQIEAAAMGTDRYGRRLTGSRARVRSHRRRRTTLASVGEQIVEEAKKMARRDLPSRAGSAGRSIAYPFAAPDRTGRTYVQSFGSRVVRVGGKLALDIYNTHEHADDVEFGNDGGRRRKITKSEGYFVIPLSKSGIVRFRRWAESPEAKKRARLQKQVSYWKNRRATLKKRAHKFLADEKEQILDNRSRSLRNLRPDYSRRIQERRAWLQRDANRANAGLAKAQAALGPSRPKTFVAKNNRTGKVSLFTKSIHTYKGYGILRRATRRITIRTIE